MPQPQNPTDDPTVEAAVAAADAQLGDDFETEDSELAPEQPAAAAAAATDDEWDREVPFEKLSGFWKNKVQQRGKPATVREIMESADSAEEKIRQQGELANTERDKARVYQAQLQALTEMMQAQNRPAPAAPRTPGFQDVGIRDANEELLRDPNSFGLGTANLGARIATEQLTPQIQQLFAKIQSLEQQNELATIRQAAEQARNALNIDAEAWEKRGPFLWAVAGQDPRTPKNPQAWIDAATGATAAFGGAPARTTTPVEGIVRGNPSGSSRPTPVRQTTAPKQRVRGLVNAVVDDSVRLAGLPADVAEKVKQRTEELLQQKESR